MIEHRTNAQLIETTSGAQLEPLQVRPDEAARLLSISRRQLDRITERGELASIGNGRMRRYAMADLRAWQARNRQEAN